MLIKKKIVRKNQINSIFYISKIVPAAFSLPFLEAFITEKLSPVWVARNYLDLKRVNIQNNDVNVLEIFKEVCEKHTRIYLVLVIYYFDEFNFLDKKSDIALKHIITLNLIDIQTTIEDPESNDSHLLNEYFDDLTHENTNEIKERYKSYFEDSKFKLDKLEIQMLTY